MSNILEVKHLKISFRTQGGRLKAVRDISFNLEKGETLAIVGESGSGKSVTSKAILGILAGNSIVEGGEILYDGKDLLKISEEDMQKIRGDKIAMIFQDPLSSLNPIVKIGPQITEAMLLKNKAQRKMARSEFNRLLNLLKENMIAVQGKEKESEVSEMIQTFDRFNIEAIKLSEPYEEQMGYVLDSISMIEDLTFRLERSIKFNMKDALSDLIRKLGKINNSFLVRGYEAKLAEFISALQSKKKQKEQDSENLISLLKAGCDFLGQMSTQTRPDFFRIGYYTMTNPGADLYSIPVEELNEKALDHLNASFMNRFLVSQIDAMTHSFAKSLEDKKSVLTAIEQEYNVLSKPEQDKKACYDAAKKLSDLVLASIDHLEINKDSLSYTFPSALSTALDTYYKASVTNPKEEARFARQTAKREALIAKGKKIDWKVVPMAVLDLDECKANILKVLDSLRARYENDLAIADQIDHRARAIALIDHLKEKASQVVFRLTKAMAKEKAIKLMDEVGIAESRIRFNQYPFEFSGGMRQRIVIAIALSANPDILICDEPTTALDVTIQAQILDLIKKLKQERNLSVIFITHDLGVVANIADKIGVMYAGKIVEYGTADEIFYDPRHPYTWALLSSMPDLDTTEKLDAIPGTPPNMIYPPQGDAFAARNKYALEIDFEMQPPAIPVSDTHWAATWLLHPDAPKVTPPAIVTERIARMSKKEENAHE